MTNEEQYAFRDWCWTCKPVALVTMYHALVHSRARPAAVRKHKARITKATMAARGIK